jgi:hypothetical protein
LRMVSVTVPAPTPVVQVGLKNETPAASAIDVPLAAATPWSSTCGVKDTVDGHAPAAVATLEGGVAAPVVALAGSGGGAFPHAVVTIAATSASAPAGPVGLIRW